LIVGDVAILAVLGLVTGGVVLPAGVLLSDNELGLEDGGDREER